MGGEEVLRRESTSLLTSTTGERRAFQCRQWQKFTKTDATNAIQKTTYKADRFILMLSRQATSGVRDACDSHPAWDVWDVGDISRKVREMDLHSGARLVEAHFGPSWRRAFLGLQGLTPFVTPAEFFRPFLNESALFNHAWNLVGRSDHIRQTHEFVESQQQKVAVLVGRGGIGKSKILHALAETFDNEHKGMSLWFMAEGVPLTQDGADRLPYKPCVVVVDDAHRRGDLPALLALSPTAATCDQAHTVMSPPGYWLFEVAAHTRWIRRSRGHRPTGCKRTVPRRSHGTGPRSAWD